MSRFSAHFFDYVQNADFYRGLHREAVALLPPGAGRSWFDVGCGPGLVTRLAHEQGYTATGFDLDPHMVALARRRSAPTGGQRYFNCSLDDLVKRHGRADVVSAASLLNVVGDRRAALERLLEAVAPDGALLVIETSGKMAATAEVPGRRNPASGRRAWVFRMWAAVRRNARAVDVDALCPQGFAVQRHSLMDGFINAWLIRPLTGTGPASPMYASIPPA